MFTYHVYIYICSPTLLESSTVDESGTDEMGCIGGGTSTSSSASSTAAEDKTTVEAVVALPLEAVASATVSSASEWLCLLPMLASEEAKVGGNCKKRVVLSTHQLRKRWRSYIN